LVAKFVINGAPFVVRSFEPRDEKRQERANSFYFAQFGAKIVAHELVVGLKQQNASVCDLVARKNVASFSQSRVKFAKSDNPISQK
jgi:hypothetical protein